MWKIWNRLFGWDYIAWKNSADQGISRVYKNFAGNGYYFRYKSMQLVDTIDYPNQVIWLTCKPEKYLD